MEKNGVFLALRSGALSRQPGKWYSLSFVEAAGFPSPPEPPLLWKPSPGQLRGERSTAAGAGAALPGRGARTGRCKWGESAGKGIAGIISQGKQGILLHRAVFRLSLAGDGASLFQLHSYLERLDRMVLGVPPRPTARGLLEGV